MEADGARLIRIDNQPIAATFFHHSRWITDFVTPNDLEIQELAQEIWEISECKNNHEKINAVHYWVSTQVKYVRFVKGRVSIGGRVSIIKDLWNMPAVTALARVGNCANKSFLGASLLRTFLPDNSVYVILGNLYNNSGVGQGHAWVEVRQGGRPYTMELTCPTVCPMIPAELPSSYEPVHIFNDKEVWAYDGRTVMKPYANCASTWLSDYLDHTYVGW